MVEEETGAAFFVEVVKQASAVGAARLCGSNAAKTKLHTCFTTQDLHDGVRAVNSTSISMTTDTIAQTNEGFDGLQTISQDGRIPKSRMSDASAVVNYIQKLVRNDMARDAKRAKVKGLTDGNPPYSSAKLRSAGRADAANFNSGMARAFLETAGTAYYNIFSEAPTYTTIKTYHGSSEDRSDWSGIMTEEFDLVQKNEAGFKYKMSISVYQMILFGCGPLFFSDKLDWRFKCARAGEVLVDENTKSDSNEWESCALRETMYPDRFFTYISNEKAARDVGWDVAAVKQAIINAHPKAHEGGYYLNWEWHQQQLKNNSFSYSQTAKTIQLAHMVFKEFPKDDEPEGKLTHVIVLENSNNQSNPTFLFRSIGRFDNWNQFMHPMYYDHGGGGEHHSVTGMGVKMYSVLEYQNRLICNLADKTFAPKNLFKPTTADDKKKLSLAVLGDFGVLPAGFDLVQTGVPGLLNDGVMFNREMTGMVTSNLSQYRSTIQREGGNPITAAESNWRASEQAKLGKSQLDRYYDQLDAVYLEKVKRICNRSLTNLVPGGREALAFQKKCEDRGVPPECFKKIECAFSTRIVGQGSSYLRVQALQQLLGMIAMFPEDGRANLISDFVAATSGQSMVERYYPRADKNRLPSDQQAEAQDKVTTMKVGMIPLVTSSQNPMIYAQTFLQAASQALASLQQGADPVEVLKFLEVCGPSIAAQLQRMQPDPSRNSAFQVLNEQFKKIAQLTDQLKKQVQKTAEERAQAMAAQAEAQRVADGTDPDMVVGMAGVERKAKIDEFKAVTAAKLKAEKQQMSNQLATAKTVQGMAILDAKSASEILRKNAQSKAEPTSAK